MKAIEDMQERRSVVTDTMHSLAGQAREWRERIDLLEAGQAVDRAAVAVALTRLLDLSQNLRDAILSEDAAATWRTTDELRSLVARLDETASKRGKILDLAARLTAGTVVHRRERTREERLQERDAAVAELMERSAQSQTLDLPGPDARLWLEWACSLDDSTGGAELAILNRDFPRLDDFVSHLEIEMWQDTPAEGHHAPNNHVATVLEMPAAHEPEPAPAWTPEPVAFTAPEIAAAESAPQIVEAVSPEPEIAIPTNGFFPIDEVERLAIHAARTRRDPQSPRTVRALIVASHWLTPWDQNPIQYPGGGITEEIGYAGKAAVGPASPKEAAELIAASGELQLLTGGADLLRWSLEHANSDRADAIASVRRLTETQIRHWFGELFKIELAEPQVQDMFRLTFGIPLLMGELHRKVVPMHDTPPTWLGYAIWTRVKQAFEAQLPALAQELKEGSPAVRLTERERSLLKMVVEASDNSTDESLLANLMENWHSYKRPEFAPLSSADETSVQLLLMLGLLPVKDANLVRPLKALTPVEVDDPIRQLVRYL